MVSFYQNGTELLNENAEFLKTNRHMAVFFYWDAPLYLGSDRENYGFLVTQGEERLLVLKVVPYNAMFFGSPAPVEEGLSFLHARGLSLPRCLCAEDVGEEIVRVEREIYGIPFAEALAMDFMEAREVTEPSCSEVTAPAPEDLNEIVACLSGFIRDCGLMDEVDVAGTKASLGDFRILRRDGLIVSMAKICPATETDLKIADVYTRPEYRGQGLARNVVNTAKNEILLAGKTATLNVDKKNPVSNHLYEALGFRKVFSQGEYRRIL